MMVEAEAEAVPDTSAAETDGAGEGDAAGEGEGEKLADGAIHPMTS